MASPSCSGVTETGLARHAACASVHTLFWHCADAQSELTEHTLPPRHAPHLVPPLQDASKAKCEFACLCTFGQHGTRRTSQHRSLVRHGHHCHKQARCHTDLLPSWQRPNTRTLHTQMGSMIHGCCTTRCTAHHRPNLRTTRNGDQRTPQAHAGQHALVLHPPRDTRCTHNTHDTPVKDVE